MRRTRRPPTFFRRISASARRYVTFRKNLIFKGEVPLARVNTRSWMAYSICSQLPSISGAFSSIRNLTHPYTPSRVLLDNYKKRALYLHGSNSQWSYLRVEEILKRNKSMEYKLYTWIVRRNDTLWYCTISYGLHLERGWLLVHISDECFWIEGGGAKFTFGITGSQLPTCGHPLKACFTYKRTVDICEDFIGSTVLVGNCIDSRRLPRSHVKLARMFIEADG
jgi:hypothetical protein